MQCSVLESKRASTYSSISGAKGTSLLSLTDQYAGKTPKSKILFHRRMTMVTRRAQLLELLSGHRYSICVYRYDDDPGRGSIAGAANDMDAGDAYDDYEGGGSDDDYEGGDTDDGGGEDDDGEGEDDG